MGRAVIVAECNQRTNFQPQVLRYLRTIVLPHFIMNHRAVFAVNHEHGLLPLDAFYFISKDWKRVEAKLLEIVEPLRVNNAGIAVGGQIETLPIDPQRLFELVEEDQSADRWFG